MEGSARASVKLVSVLSRIVLAVAIIGAAAALIAAPMGSVARADSLVTVSDLKADNVTSVNALLSAKAYKSPDVDVDTCGIYLGTSEAGMTKQNTETVPASSNGYSFVKMWYDLNDELHITLKPSTTYYFKFYCTVNGVEYVSEARSFTTAADVDSGVTVKQHVEKQEEIRKKVDEAVSAFERNDGTVKSGEEDAYLDAAYDCFKQVGGDEIVSVDRNDTCVWAEFEDGSLMACAPAIEGFESMPVDQVCSIQTYEPCNDTFGGYMNYIRMTDEAADYLSGISSYWHRDVVRENDGVSIDALKELGLRGGNEIIFWRGHGYYIDGRGSCLIIGEAFSPQRYAEDRAYNEEFTKGYLVKTAKGNVAITPKFVREYIHDLDGALVYLGACMSGHDEQMANAWIGAGAKTVVGFSESVSVSYDGVMTRDFAKALCTKDANGRYKSAQKALAEAKKANGESDPASYDGKHAKLMLFGDGGFCFDESLDDVYGAYLEIVQEYQARYGDHTVKRISINGSEMDAVAGLGLVDIVDFDADGTDELVLGYGDESKFKSSDAPFSAYTLEVWAYENGKAKKVYTVGPHKGDGVNIEVADAVMFEIVKAKTAGKPSYIRSVSNDSITYNTLKGGSFSAVDVLRIDCSGNSVQYFVNGSKVSESEYGRYEDRYSGSDFESDNVMMGDFLWNDEPYDFELEVFSETDWAINRLMIGTTDAADEDYRDNNGFYEKTGKQ